MHVLCLLRLHHARTPTAAATPSAEAQDAKVLREGGGWGRGLWGRQRSMRRGPSSPKGAATLRRGVSTAAWEGIGALPTVGVPLKKLLLLLLLLVLLLPVLGLLGLLILLGVVVLLLLGLSKAKIATVL